MARKPFAKLQSHLEEKARWIWKETLLCHQRGPETRIASSLSCIEILVALYYGGVLNFNAGNQFWDGRDRFIISKGHGSIAMYPLLADLGYFAHSELEKVCQEGSFLGGIPDPVIPGYETVNGSLGHGLGVAAGIAVALKQKKSASRVFVLVGDGELYEGSNWEAAMFAAHHCLDNLILIIDHNKIAMLDYCEKIVDHAPLAAKFAAFGWQTAEVDGHDLAAVYETLWDLKEGAEPRPRLLVAHTIKGKGVPELEASPLCHVLSVKPERIEQLLRRSL